MRSGVYAAAKLGPINMQLGDDDNSSPARGRWRGEAVTEGEDTEPRCRLPPPPSCLRHATSPWRGRTYATTMDVDPA